MTKKLRLFVRLAFALSAAALLMASTAAADEPILTIGNNGTVDACLGDQHSGVNTEATNPIALNDRSCAATSGGSGGSGGSGSSGSSGSSGGSGGGSSQGGVGAAAPSSPSGSAAPAAPSAPTAGAAWVSASGALGLRIASVRVQLTGVTASKRFLVVVTLRDLRGKLVRGGIVKVDRVPGAVNTIRGSDATFTNRVGKARLGAAVTKKQLGTRVLVRISARTPKARALQLRSVYLPG
jgi:hypothetical protein